MKEIVLTNRKIGMPVLLGEIVLYLLLTAGLIFAINNGSSSVVVWIFLLTVAWTPLMGQIGRAHV